MKGFGIAVVSALLLSGAASVAVANAGGAPGQGGVTAGGMGGQPGQTVGRGGSMGQGQAAGGQPQGAPAGQAPAQGGQRGISDAPTRQSMDELVEEAKSQAGEPPERIDTSGSDSDRFGGDD